MVGLQTLDLAIGVRVPASQPNHSNQPLIELGSHKSAALFDSTRRTLGKPNP